MKSYKEIFTDKQKILFIVAHPDDLEAYFGGLASKLIIDKKDVYVAIATNGVNGLDNQTKEKNPQLRISEVQAAWQILGGIQDNLFTFDFADGEIDVIKLRERITWIIRKVQPNIICTHDPEILLSDAAELGSAFVNHVDHRLVGLTVVDVVSIYARSLNFFPEHSQQKLAAWEVSDLYLTADHYPHPNTQIDISEVINKKRQAMLAHRSQFSIDIVSQIINEDNLREEKFYEFGKYVHLLG